MKLPDRNFKFAVHVVFLNFRLFLLLIKLDLLLLDVLQAFLDVLETALGVVVAQQVCTVVGYLLLQVLLLGRLGGERTNLGLHAGLEVSHYQLAVLNLCLHILELLLQLLDDVEVLLRDVIVILFHLTEGILVVDHEIVDVLVLALLNLVDLDLHTEGQLALQVLHLRIILLNQSLFVRLELLLKDL